MKRYIDCLCLCVLLAVCCVACREEEDASAVRSGFLISLVEAPQVGVEARATIEVGEYSFNTSHLTITNKDNGKNVYDEEFTKVLIPVPTGTYDIEVSLGEDVVLAKDAPFFKGTAVGTVEEGTNNVSVGCSLANALLSVKFGKDEEAASRFDKFFSDYKVKVACGSLSISIGEGEKVYFKVGSSLVLTFEGTLKESGKVYTYNIPAENISVAAKDHTILTLAVAPVEAGVAVKVTKAEVNEETISSTIPMSWLPKPTVSATGFDATNSLSVVETETASASIDFKLPSALQNMKFKFHFEDEQFKSLNNQEYYYLLKDKELLEETLGLVFPAGETKENGTIGLDALINKLQTNAGITTNNTITVAVQTSNDKWSDDFTCTLQCKKPTFHVSVYPGNIWTKEFTVNALMEEQVETGSYEKLSGDMTYQYSADQTTWNNLTDLTVTGLEPRTKYYVRGMYRGEVPGEVMEMETYPIITLENGNMESWCYVDGPQASTYPKGPFWKRWYIKDIKDDSSAGWCSLNGYTTKDNDPKAYISNSGTERTTICHSGSYAAEIKTIGWGKNTAAAAPFSDITSITPGELFLGYLDSSNNPVYDYSFRSKPTRLLFYYRYVPDGDHTFTVEIFLYSGNDIIAKNNFEGGKTDGEDFVEKYLSFNYEPLKETITPTSISIRFVSGENSRSEVDKASVLRGTRHTGNILYIDDIELIYDK